MCTINYCKFCNKNNFIIFNKHYINNDVILLNLGNHYHYRHHNFKLMKKYYLMAIEKGNSSAMILL